MKITANTIVICFFIVGSIICISMPFIDVHKHYYSQYNAKFDGSVKSVTVSLVKVPMPGKEEYYDKVILDNDTMIKMHEWSCLCDSSPIVYENDSIFKKEFSDTMYLYRNEIEIAKYERFKSFLLIKERLSQWQDIKH